MELNMQSLWSAVQQHLHTHLVAQYFQRESNKDDEAQITPRTSLEATVESGAGAGASGQYAGGSEGSGSEDSDNVQDSATSSCFFHDPTAQRNSHEDGFLTIQFRGNSSFSRAVSGFHQAHLNRWHVHVKTDAGLTFHHPHSESTFGKNKMSCGDAVGANPLAVLILPEVFALGAAVDAMGVAGNMAYNTHQGKNKGQKLKSEWMVQDITKADAGKIIDLYVDEQGYHFEVIEDGGQRRPLGKKVH
jgi:hypothetical protein